MGLKLYLHTSAITERALIRSILYAGTSRKDNVRLMPFAMDKTAMSVSS